jgi:hypothetical protein
VPFQSTAGGRGLAPSRLLFEPEERIGLQAYRLEVSLLGAEDYAMWGVAPPPAALTPPQTLAFEAGRPWWRED